MTSYHSYDIAITPSFTYHPPQKRSPNGLTKEQQRALRDLKEKKARRNALPPSPCKNNNASAPYTAFSKKGSASAPLPHPSTPLQQSCPPNVKGSASSPSLYATPRAVHVNMHTLVVARSSLEKANNNMPLPPLLHTLCCVVVYVLCGC